MEYSALTIGSQNQTEEDEAALVAAARKDHDLFQVLYQRYVDRIYRYMRIRTDNDEDAADLTQQVFLQALNALSHYRSRGIPFAAWLFRIARHLATDYYRRAKKTVSWDLLPDMPHDTTNQDPETILLQREALEQLREVLLEFDPYKRELLALRFAAGLNTAEIAKTMGKSQASVKKQLTRILYTLKEKTQGARS